MFPEQFLKISKKPTEFLIYSKSQLPIILNTCHSITHNSITHNYHSITLSLTTVLGNVEDTVV